MGNFAEEFTRLEPVYSPPGSPPPGDPRIFQVSESCCQPRPGADSGPVFRSGLSIPPRPCPLAGYLELSVIQTAMAGQVFELHGSSLIS